MITLSKNEEIIAKTFIIDLLCRGGLKAKGTCKHRQINGSALNYFNFAKSQPKFADVLKDKAYIAEIEAAAAKVCQFITGRTFIHDIDTHIKTLARMPFSDKFPVAYVNNDPYDNTVYKQVKDWTQVCKYICWFCQDAKIFWNDSLASKEEFELFSENYMAQAIMEAGLLMSQVDGKRDLATENILTIDEKLMWPTKDEPTTTKRRVKFITNRIRPKGHYQGAPDNIQRHNYKSAPNVQAKARGITDPNKVFAPGAFVYVIQADKIGSSVPSVKINPLTPDGAKGNTNYVKLTTSKGYSDCVLYFFTAEAADQFFGECASHNRLIPKYSNPAVRRLKANSGGYFSIDTEFGGAYILAKKLNEALEEQMNNQVSTDKEIDLSEAFDNICTDDCYDPVVQKRQKDRDYVINDIDVYEEAFSKYL